MGKNSLTQSTAKKAERKKTTMKKNVEAESPKKSPEKTVGKASTPKGKSAAKAKPRKSTEKKVAAEKEIIERAAAEKVVAEKEALDRAAAEKAAAPAQKAHEPPPPPAEPPDPSDHFIKFGFIGFGVLILILILASFSNTDNYYLKTAGGAVEIWQGKFSPMGSERIVMLPGAQYSGPVKEVYSREEVYPLAFNYYVEKADMLLDVPGFPDFEGIKTYLHKADDFVINRESRRALNARLNGIEIMTLVYKADVAASKERIADLETAITLLEKADKIAADESSKKMIQEKIASANGILQTLRAAAIQKSESAMEK